jgi:uncharacterized membrane protein
MRVASIGHAVFAATIVALGVLGAVKGDFGAIWQPVPKGIPARETLAYLCAFVSIAAGIGMLWAHAAAAASRVLLAYLVIWLLVFRVPVIFRQPMVEVSWESCGETAVFVAGAWTLYASLASDWDQRHLGLAVGESGLRIARIVFGLALIPFGLTHVAYVAETAALVPDWLPSHVVWVYLTGGTYFAAAAAILAGVGARLAAALSAWQMGLFTLLVWVPIVAKSPNAFQWSEAIDSWALTAAAWVVADSYRRIPTLAEQQSRCC